MIVSTPLDQLLNPLRKEEPVKAQGLLDKEDFLMLLVTQMKYQNPFDPIGNQDFGAQLAAFSSLEQLTNLNKTMKASQLANLQLTQSISNAMSASLIGKRILAENNRFAHISPEKDVLKFTLTDSADTVRVRIVSQAGITVYEEDLGAKPKGVHDFLWDGLDKNGNLAIDGQYFFEVSAAGSSGQNVAGTLMTAGIVTAVRFSGGQAYLIINDVVIPMSEVIEILAEQDANGS